MNYHVHKIALLILIVLGTTSCQDRGGGVIISNDPKTTTTVTPPVIIPENEGPFGGPLNNDSSIPDASVYLPNYNTFDIEQKIALANVGDTIVIDRNVDLNFTLYIEKSIKLQALNKNIVITARNLTNAIESAVDNITIKNFVINLYNTKGLVTTASNGLALPLRTGLVVTGNTFYLSGSSVLTMFINGINFSNNSVFGLTNSERDIPVMQITGDNSNFYGNNIFDYTQKYNTALLIKRSNNINIKNNFLLSYSKLFNGSITFLEANNVNVEENYLQDENTDRIMNNTFSIDPDNDGSIALALKESHFVTDNNNINYIYAMHGKIDDVGNGYITESSFINLTNFSIISKPSRSTLFNNLSSYDFTPICLLGTNKTISSTPVNNFKSYILSSGQTIYYSGAIVPACI